MANAASIQAGEAFVKIWANDEEARKALKGLQAKVKAFADEVSAIGKRVALVGAVIAAPFAKSAKVFAGFKDQMSTIRAVTKANDADFARLTATAKKLGETTSFTAQQAAEGMLALSRAGYDADRTIAAIPGTLNLARAGALGLGEASTIMADTAKAFGITADQSDRVGDALAKASNIANTDVRLIGESMKHVAATANLSGQSLENVSSALSVMANQGVKGEMAGTALRKVLIELANAKVQASLKKDFGIDVKDAKGGMRDVMVVMRELSEATRGMGNADKLALFKDMFDARGMQSAVILTENIDQWEEYAAKVRDAAGTAAEMAREMDNNLGGSFRLMMSAVEGVQIAIGEATEGTLRDWMASIEKCAQSVSKFVTENKDFVVGVMKIAAVLAGAGAAFYVFGKGAAVVSGVIGLFTRAASGMKSMQDRITGLGAAERDHKAALEEKRAALEQHEAALKKEEQALQRVQAAQQGDADSAKALIEAKNNLAKAESEAAAAKERAAKMGQGGADDPVNSDPGVKAAQKKAFADAIAQGDKSHGQALLHAERELDRAQRERIAREKSLAQSTKEYGNATERAESAIEVRVAAERRFAAAQEAATGAQKASKAQINELAKATEHLTKARERASKALFDQREAAKQTAKGKQELTDALKRENDLRQAAEQKATARRSDISKQYANNLNNGPDVRDAKAKALSAAQKEVETTAQGVIRAQEGVARAEANADAATARLEADTRKLASAQDTANAAAGRLNTAGYRLAEATDRIGVAMRRASGYVAQFGSPKVMAAFGSVAALAGSVSMLAGGESTIGQIAGTVSQIAGIGLAASGAVAGVMALKTAMASMSAGALVATKALIALAVAYAAFKAGQAINNAISGFDGDQIAKDAKHFAQAAEDGSDNLLQAQQKILARIGELQRREAEQGVDLGAFRLVNPFGDNKALNAEIAALQNELEGVEAQYRAQKKSAEAAKKAADEAAETERIEANRQAVNDLAQAWDDVCKKLDEVNKRRADRQQEKDFDAKVERDPYEAKDHATAKFDESKQAEAAIVARLKELEAKRQELLASGAPETQALNELEKTMGDTLEEYQRAVETTDVWERFFDKADSAVTRTRESLAKLADDAKKLDIDYARKQDDQRFKDRLKTDWGGASNEVAQAMARVNAEWIDTGRQVAELQAKADGGDINAQRQLEGVLKRRGELASERGNLESRQQSVDAALKDGQGSIGAVREVMDGERKRKARTEWDQAAARDPRAANAALSGFIANLEADLAKNANLAEQAFQRGDLSSASAFEEKVKQLAGDLSEARGLEGQKQERSEITGDFNARAMEAMMRGGGAKSLEKEQLETQKSMDKHLKELVGKTQTPSVVAVD